MLKRRGSPIVWKLGERRLYSAGLSFCPSIALPPSAVHWPAASARFSPLLSTPVGGNRIDLRDEETTALVRLLTNAIDHRFPLSLGVQLWRWMLAKIRPAPTREPLPPPKRYEPPARGQKPTSRTVAQ